MICIISKENCIVRAGRRNARRDIRSVTHHIAIPMQACTQWTHSDVLSQLATTPEWSFKIGDRQNAKRQWNSDRRATYNATRSIAAGRGVIRHRGVSDGSDGARPLWPSHSARTEYFFPDVPSQWISMPRNSPGGPGLVIVYFSKSFEFTSITAVAAASRYDMEMLSRYRRIWIPSPRR